jgi:hypothetical protein
METTINTPPKKSDAIIEINDIREPKEFKGISFSEYKKIDVRVQLLNNIHKGKMEQAQYWSCELICAGHYMEIWETILYYIGKYIHLGNPKLIIYIENRFDIFKGIVQQGLFLNELQLRNNPTIRRLFAEVVGTLLYSNKKPSFELLKINRIEEFDITQMTERLKAPGVHFLDDIFIKGDPKEIFIPLNEFAFHVSANQRNMMGACYWVEWLIEFDIVCKGKKEKCICERRPFVSVENKFSKDIIWLLFDVIFQTLKKNGDNPFLNKLLTSILHLFSIKYSHGIAKKRRYLLYMAVAVLCEPIPTNIDIMGNKAAIIGACENIDVIYKQIKKSEHSSNTEYLFRNIDSKNEFKKSMMKMEMVNSIDLLGGGGGGM